MLKGAFSVTTTTIQVNGADRHYALVASSSDNGVQIINITDPSRPSAVVGITDCDIGCIDTDYPVLKNAVSVTTTTIDTSHYALVASNSLSDNGVQIINITDPSRPSAVVGITNYTAIQGASSVTTTTIQVNGTDRHYALVASITGKGVQIIDITNPLGPTAVASVTDNSTANPTDYTELQGANSVTTTQIGSRHYAPGRLLCR